MGQGWRCSSAVRPGCWQMGDSARLFDTYTTTDCDTTDLVMGESIHNLRDMLKIFCRKFEAKTPAQEQQVCYDLPVHSYSTHLKNVEDTFYDHFTRIECPEDQ